MAIAFDVASESHTGTSGHSGSASYTWNHGGGASARGALVFVYTIASSSVDTSVTYGGVTMAAIPYTASVSSGENYFVRAYYLDNCGTGTKAVVVNRTNNATVSYAQCFTVTNSGELSPLTEVYLAGVVTKAGGTTNTGASSTSASTGNAAVIAVDDGSPGANSVRFCGQGWGGSNVLAAGTGSTAGPSIDFGLYTIGSYRETTAGQGSRNVGSAAGTGDDVAAIALAVREKPPITGSLTAAAVIFKTMPGSGTANAVIKRAITQSPSPTADATVRRLVADETHTADAVIFKAVEQSLVADAIVWREQAGSAAANAYIAHWFTAGSWIVSEPQHVHADAIVLRNQAGSAASDAVIFVQQSGSASASAIVIATIAGSRPADAIVKRAQSGSLGTDAIRKRTFYFGSGPDPR